MAVEFEQNNHRYCMKLYIKKPHKKQTTDMFSLMCEPS